MQLALCIQIVILERKFITTISTSLQVLRHLTHRKKRERRERGATGIRRPIDVDRELRVVDHREVTYLGFADGARVPRQSSNV